MSYKTLQLAYEGRVAILTLNRPEKRNAISFELIDDVLRALDEGREGHKPLARIDDLPLFAPQAPSSPAHDSAVEQALRDVSADMLTPRQALELLYALKAKLSD